MSTYQLMHQLDQDDSGMVEFVEFVRVMAKRAEKEKIIQKEEEFKNAFKVQILFLNEIYIHHYIFFRCLTVMGAGRCLVLS